VALLRLDCGYETTGAVLSEIASAGTAAAAEAFNRLSQIKGKEGEGDDQGDEKDEGRPEEAPSRQAPRLAIPLYIQFASHAGTFDSSSSSSSSSSKAAQSPSWSDVVDRLTGLDQCSDRGLDTFCSLLFDPPDREERAGDSSSRTGPPSQNPFAHLSEALRYSFPPQPLLSSIVFSVSLPASY
jgi:hypothetical protein